MEPVQEMVLTAIYYRADTDTSAQALDRVRQTASLVEMLRRLSADEDGPVRDEDPALMVLRHLRQERDALEESIATLVAYLRTQDRPHSLAVLADALRMSRSGVRTLPRSEHFERAQRLEQMSETFVRESVAKQVAREPG